MDITLPEDSRKPSFRVPLDHDLPPPRLLSWMPEFYPNELSLLGDAYVSLILCNN